MAKITRPQAEINEQQKRPGYVCLARDLCLAPPIKHRHTSARRMYLTPFEFGVAMAAVAAATTQWWNDDVHNPARAASGETIKRRSQYIKAGRGKGRRKRPPPFSQSEWEMTHLIRSGYLPEGKARFPVKSGLKLVGSSAYRRNCAKLMMKAPATMMVVRSPRALLVSVGLPPSGRNHRKLAAALNRLLKPVADHPPVLESWERLKDGRLRLQVCGAWFPRRAYARLPLPLPLRSPVATSLYLFLNAIRTDYMNTTDIASKSLFDRLGMASRGQAKQRVWDTIRAALKSINEHLAELDGANLKRHRLIEAVPWRYEIDAVKGARRVRFLAIPRNPDEREAVESDLEEQRRQEESKYARRRAEQVDDDQTDDEDQTDDIEIPMEWVHAAPLATRRMLGVVDDED